LANGKDSIFIVLAAFMTGVLLILAPAAAAAGASSESGDQESLDFTRLSQSESFRLLGQKI
jgi:hypothetical protein